MMIENGDQLFSLFGAIPSQDIVQRICCALSLTNASNDLYLAYAAGCGFRFVGFLISSKGNISDLIALCPIHADFVVGSAMWCLDVHRQLLAAVGVASLTLHEGIKNGEMIWLKGRTQTKYSIPPWIYSLACIPVSYAWDGNLQYPRPFSPELFEAMAKQPQAPEWLANWLNQRCGSLAEGGHIT